MKKVFLAALLVVGITTFAQQKKEEKRKDDKLTTEQKVNLQVKKMTTDLDLNADQVKQLQVLVTKQVEKKEAKKAEIKESKDEERQQMRAEMDANREAFNSEMKKILTPEQFIKWGKARDERKEKMLERRSMKPQGSLPESK